RAAAAAHRAATRSVIRPRVGALGLGLGLGARVDAIGLRLRLGYLHRTFVDVDFLGHGVGRGVGGRLRLGLRLWLGLRLRAFVDGVLRRLLGRRIDGRLLVVTATRERQRCGQQAGRDGKRQTAGR